jgi:hypothetical protein
MNKKPITIAAALLTAAVANAIDFNFETTTLGFYPGSLSVSSSGLTLTITPEGFPNAFVAVDNLSVPPLLGTRSVIGSQVNPLQSNEFTPLRFAFSTPVSSATFLFGDNGGDTDSPVLISAYDGGGNLLSTLNETYDAGVDTGKAATWSGTGASYFILSSLPADNPNSIYWEAQDVVPNNSVPESGSTIICLLMSSSALFGLRRFRFTRAQA